PRGNRMKRYLPFIIIVLVAIGAVTSGAILYRAKVAELTPVAKDRKVAETQMESEGAHVRGSATAPVTLEEFGDFQCPPCGSLAGVLLRIESDFGAQLRVVFRNFPLAVHNHAAEAARAAEAAGLQGKFWEMHDLLFRNQALWSKDPDAKLSFMNYAEEIGINLERFERDYDGDEPRARISTDQARGTALGVTSTPTLFINNQPLPPASMNEPALRAAISAAARGESSAPSPTPAPIATPTL
ncbi:MAG: DsbA family protein, partial [Verrucomicrobiota bacterium]|nr:DsbA family protein [Verrucomicrobiota bacterium]